VLRGGNVVEAAYLEINGFSEVSGQELLASEQEAGSRRQSAEEFLREALSDGPGPSKTISAEEACRHSRARILPAA
jgi:hypothetical protein